MNVLLIINDPPYGTEKAYNALRLAMTLQKEHQGAQLRVFLLGDAVGTAVSGQNTAQGYYNLERMLRSVIMRGGEVSCCTSCLDARGLSETALVEGVTHGTMSQLAGWTLASDKLAVF